MSETPLELRTSRVGDAVIIAVAGEIDMASAPELSQVLANVDDRADRVVVDLSQVDFLDSSALNALVNCERLLDSRGIGFRLVSPADQALRRVFDITHLTEPLHVVSSLDDALA